MYNGWPIEPPEDDFDLEATDDVSYRDDADQVIVCLMPMQKYIRCSADATMIHLKKFVDVVDYENVRAHFDILHYFNHKNSLVYYGST